MRQTPTLAMADDRFPDGKAVGFALLSSALLEIEEQRGKGQGSRKRMTVRSPVIWRNGDKPMVFFLRQTHMILLKSIRMCGISFVQR